MLRLSKGFGSYQTGNSQSGRPEEPTTVIENNHHFQNDSGIQSIQYCSLIKEYKTGDAEESSSSESDADSEEEFEEREINDESRDIDIITSIIENQLNLKRDGIDQDISDVSPL